MFLMIVPMWYFMSCHIVIVCLLNGWPCNLFLTLTSSSEMIACILKELAMLKSFVCACTYVHRYYRDSMWCQHAHVHAQSVCVRVCVCVCVCARACVRVCVCV